MRLSDYVGQSKYLTANDFDRPQCVTISHVREEEVGQEREVHAVLYFDELEKGLVLNATNTATVIGICGSDDDQEIVGFKIVVLKDKTTFGGKLVDCIRVRPVKAGSDPDLANQKLRESRGHAPAEQLGASGDIPF